MAEKTIPREKILAWLQKSGFPFEIEVGRRLSSANWIVSHAQPYEDPVEKKLREIDLMATHYVKLGDDPPDFPLSFVLAVECKRNPKKHPWVAFVDLTPKFRFPRVVTPDGVGRNLLLRSDPKILGNCRSFTAGPTPAHALVEARIGDDGGRGVDQAYKATLGCANAAIARVERNHKAILGGSLFPHVEIILPVVVVDGPLFQYSINDDGQETLKEQAHLNVLLNHPVGGLLTIQVVTSDGLDAFANSTIVEAVKLEDGLLEHLDEVTKNFVLRASDPNRTWRLIE